MAALALGAVGGYFFGPLGFLIGSALGNWLDPPKGPQLNDLKLQTSQYGDMIPLLYGQARLSGEVIWQTDLMPNQQGGKGGPIYYTYSASWAVKICKGPVGGLLRIWADSTIIWDVTAGSTVNNSAIPLTFYRGVETAGPDPTMQAVLGAGNVPAFRDDCVAVFDNMDLSNYGNRLPTLSFEVYNASGPIPWRVATWTPATDPNNPGFVLCTTQTGTTITTAYYNELDATYNEYDYAQDGTLINSSSVPIDLINGIKLPNYGSYRQCTNLQSTFAWMAVGGVFYGAWYAENIISANNITYVLPGGLPNDVQNLVQGNPIYQNGFVYSIGSIFTGMTFVCRWTAPSGVPTATIPAPVYSLGISAASARLGTSDDGLIYVLHGTGGSGAGIALWEFDADLNLLRTWTGVQLPGQVAGGLSFVVYEGNIVGVQTSGVSGACVVFGLESPGRTFPIIGTLSAVTTGCLVRLQNGLCMTNNGVISLDPQGGSTTLSAIVADISQRAGLTSQQYDVSQLYDTVDGYIISRQAAAKEAITPLQSAFFFDGVESTGVMKFVRRGSYPIITIPDSDCAAQEPKSTPPPIRTIKRTQEVDLPAAVNVTYMDVNSWYQDGSQMARRQATSAQSVSNIQLAIAMDIVKARQVANVLLYGSWLEREGVTILLPMKYQYLEPCDVIVAGVYTLRVVSKSYIAVGIIQLDCVVSLPSLYISAPAGNATLGGLTPPTPTSSSPTNLLLLNLPLTNDTDAPYGIYAAMDPETPGTVWPGATLFESSDGGATYASAGSTTTPATVGVTSTLLGDYLGGNTFDQINSVEVVLSNGSLASASQIAVMNGANECVIGKELMQFSNATLIATDSYVLTGLLRGRRGTEFATGSHQTVGENFALLPVLDVNTPFADLGVTRDFKAVSTGGTLASASALPFLNTGNTLRCYSPAQLCGGVNDTGGDIVIDWKRRTRIGGAWVDLTDVSLSESSEAYIVQIWDSTYTICANIYGVSTPITGPTFTYTAADQVADFGRIQTTVYVSVGQLGMYGLGTQAFAAINGGGSHIDAPAHPVAPYNTLPPAPPAGPGCVPSGTLYTHTYMWGTADIFQVTLNPGDILQYTINVPSNPVAQYGNISGIPLTPELIGTFASISAAPCGPPIVPFAATANDLGFEFGWATGPNAQPQNYISFMPSTSYYLQVSLSVTELYRIQMTSRT